MGYIISTKYAYSPGVTRNFTLIHMGNLLPSADGLGDKCI